MPYFIVNSDITQMEVDAIVNPANPTLLGGGGLDGEIHRAAGEKLLKKCLTLKGCKTGEAKLTKGYDLPAKYIIHTVGPIWHGGNSKEYELLHECYRNVLVLAAKKKFKTLAIPIISAGAYGFPAERSKLAAEYEIKEFLQKNDMTVYLVLREKLSAEKSRLFSQIEYYMMQNGISDTADIPAEIEYTLKNENIEPREAPEFYKRENVCSSESSGENTLDKCVRPKTKDTDIKYYSPTVKHKNNEFDTCTLPKVSSSPATVKSKKTAKSLSQSSPKDFPLVKASLEDMLANLDAGFSETLLRLIDSSGMTDTECYKRANIDRKLFSKIRSDKNYRPSKPTVIAFAIALKLNLDDTNMLLERAGFALSRASKFDVIIEYFITTGNYDIYEINDALFTFDQNLLGA